MSDDFQRRDCLSHQALFDTFYARSALDPKLVAELFDHVATELRLEVGKLRPADRFGVELSHPRADAWDGGYGILIYELQTLAKRRGISLERRINSVDDYIRAMTEVY